MSDIATERMSIKEKIMWFSNITIPLLILCIPENDILTMKIKIFLAITVFAILMFAFELVDNTMPALLLPVAYLLAGLAPGDIVFSPWSSSMPWMLISALIIINICERNNLLKRLSYFCIIKTGCSYNGIIYGIMFTGIIINLILPGAALLPVIILAAGVCNELELKRTKAATGIMFASALAAVVPWLCILAPNFPGVLAISVKAHFGIEINYVSYMLHNLPIFIWCFFLVWLVTKVFKPEKAIEGKAYFTESLNKIGKISDSEKKTIMMLLLLLAFIVTSPVHKLDMGWGFVLVSFLMFMPGVNLGSKEDVTNLNFSLIVFVTACMSIGAVSNVLGIGEISARLALPLLEGKSSIFVLGMVWLLGVLVNFLLTPLAAISAFTVPLTNIAMSLDLSPLPIYYTLLQGLEQYILPYEHFPYLFMMSFGLVKTIDFAKFFFFKMILSFLFLLCIMIPYWTLVGLF